MSRIYFDSNVFSNLRNGSHPKYIAIRDAIEKYKDNLTFFFSHAHIRDKINDTTDFKFEDFKFMEYLVKDNYLSYHAIEKRTSSYLATPKEVFEDNDSLTNVDFFVDITGDTYKDLRELIDKGDKGMAYTIGMNTYVLNELFNDGIIKEKFVDFIKDSLYHTDKSKIPYYDFYLHSYAILDILGFSKDKLGKKNSFNNLFNDSLHSYYARYCDYFITEDEALRKKSSLLYNEYEVSTKLLSVDDFLEVIDSIGSTTDNNLTQFFKKLSTDLATGNVISNGSEGGMNVYIISAFKKYFNFFDLVHVMKTSEGDVFVFLLKEEEHYLSSPNYRECGMITDKMIKILESDLNGKGHFDFDSEVLEMKSGSWQGRYWEVGDTRIYLQINESSKNFCVQIGPFSRWLFTSHFK